MAGEDGSLRDWYLEKVNFLTFVSRIYIWIVVFISLIFIGIDRFIFPLDLNLKKIIGIFVVVSFLYFFLFFLSKESFALYFQKFICHNCLKTILIKDIEKITCPFCDKTPNTKTALIMLIFDHCLICKGKLQYLACPKCGQPINLFAPYNEKELEAKRYD